VTEFCVIIIDLLLPLLASLIFSSSGDVSTVSLRLFSEIACIFLTHEMFEMTQHQSQIKKLHQLVSDMLLPKYEFILLQPDPLPSYGLKLLLALIEQHPLFIRDIERLGLIPVFFQVLEDHRSSPLSSAVKQIVAIICCLVTHKVTNMKELYEQGFVNHLNFLFLETSRMCLNTDSSDVKSLTVMLASLLDTTHGALKFVSDVVRRALDARKLGRGDGLATTHETQEAEELLLLNKPLALFINPLTQLLVHEDSDIADMSLKVLSLLVQLYGAETVGTLTVPCLESYALVLKTSDGKKLKVILRILKRIISADTSHVELMRQHGGPLAETIRGLGHTASSNADLALAELAADILKLIGYRL
jgi:serine/threonine-protein kinase ULK4